jgi:hypothetical protein
MADVQQIIQNQTTIPDYARPYVENLLGQTAGVLYNYARDDQGNTIKDPVTGMPIITGFNPMGEYDGERTAQFTKLQRDAFTGAENLGKTLTRRQLRQACRRQHKEPSITVTPLPRTVTCTTTLHPIKQGVLLHNR